MDNPIFRNEVLPADFLGNLHCNLIVLSLPEEVQQGKVINGDPFSLAKMTDEKILNPPSAVKEMLTLSMSPYATADFHNARVSENAFTLENLE